MNCIENNGGRRCILLLLALTFRATRAFILHKNIHRSPYLFHSSTQNSDEIAVIGVVAPLTYSGPYACLGLDFHNTDDDTSPNERNSKQQINFVLDTGANVNTIKRELAESLNLPTVIKKDSLSVIGSAGVGGSFEAGDIVMLGDCYLSGMPQEQSNMLFMRNLTAASMDIGIASAVGGGLLGIPFFDCFPAGVEFDWYGTDGDQPTMIFYYGKELPDYAKNNTFCVPIEGNTFFSVPVIRIRVNGVDIRAIVDTGSCISILSPKASEAVGLRKSVLDGDDHTPVVKIQGIDNSPVGLDKAANANVTIGNSTFTDVKSLFIGDLPGVLMAGNFSAETPQALIGLDVLKLMYRMILRLPNKELWFEEIPSEIA